MGLDHSFLNHDHGDETTESYSINQDGSPRGADSESKKEYEAGIEDCGLSSISQMRSETRSRPDQVILTWEPNDPDNPYNWSKMRKYTMVTLTGILVINSTMGSSLPSMAIPTIAKDFGVTNQEQMVLPISVYLIGYVVGPIIWGPLSEHLGRRTLTLITFSMFTIFTMACALAPNWPSVLVFRLLVGVFASSPIAIVAGQLADIFNEPRMRGRAFSVFMVATVFGPLLSPIISGFVTPSLGWRWVFWIGLIFAGFTFILTIFLPETYGPILLTQKARKLRKQDPIVNANIVAPHELEETDMKHLLTVVLTRPLRMIAFEPIVTCTCAYLALLYAIFYMSFQAFPLIFHEFYGLSSGLTGVIYLPIGGGAMLSLGTFWWWDNVLLRAVARGEPWTKREEYRRLPLATIGGPLFVASLFWLGWSARHDVSFVVPMLAGIPFGMGFVLIFMALINYLTDAYEIFAASANAAASTCRSLFAVVLPLATTPMFNRLGISGACSLLGGLSALMCIIPFIFIWKGPDIRARSPFCIAIRERREEMQRKAEEELARREARERRHVHKEADDAV